MTLLVSAVRLIHTCELNGVNPFDYLTLTTAKREGDAWSCSGTARS